MASNLRIADALGRVAARHSVATASVAVARALAWPGVTGAIVGARRPDQVDGWLLGASLALTASDLAEIAALEGAGIGPAALGGDTERRRGATSLPRT